MGGARSMSRDGEESNAHAPLLRRTKRAKPGGGGERRRSILQSKEEKRRGSGDASAGFLRADDEGEAGLLRHAAEEPRHAAVRGRRRHRRDLLGWVKQWWETQSLFPPPEAALDRANRMHTDRTRMSEDWFIIES